MLEEYAQPKTIRKAIDRTRDHLAYQSREEKAVLAYSRGTMTEYLSNEYRRLGMMERALAESNELRRNI